MGGLLKSGAEAGDGNPIEPEAPIDQGFGFILRHQTSIHLPSKTLLTIPSTWPFGFSLSVAEQHETSRGVAVGCAY